MVWRRLFEASVIVQNEPHTQLMAYPGASARLSSLNDEMILSPLCSILLGEYHILPLCEISFAPCCHTIFDGRFLIESTRAL